VISRTLTLAWHSDQRVLAAFAGLHLLKACLDKVTFLICLIAGTHQFVDTRFSKWRSPRIFFVVLRFSLWWLVVLFHVRGRQGVRNTLSSLRQLCELHCNDELPA